MPRREAASATATSSARARGGGTRTLTNFKKTGIALLSIDTPTSLRSNTITLVKYSLPRARLTALFIAMLDSCVDIAACISTSKVASRATPAKS